jgi:uncharacterized membrane protein HdeD (DUF308 family)
MNEKVELAEQQLTGDLRNLIFIRGISMAIVGIILLVYPLATVTILLIIMGIMWLIDGLTTIIKSIKGRKNSKAWGWGIFTGALGVFAGLVVLSQPAFSALLTTGFLVWFLGISAVIYGINGIVTGIRLRKEIRGEWSMILGGAFSIIFGIILMVSPLVSALVIIKTMGIIALIGGISIFFFALRLKKKK